MDGDFEVVAIVIKTGWALLEVLYISVLDSIGLSNLLLLHWEAWIFKPIYFSKVKFNKVNENVIILSSSLYSWLFGVNQLIFCIFPPPPAFPSPQNHMNLSLIFPFLNGRGVSSRKLTKQTLSLSWQEKNSKIFYLNQTWIKSRKMQAYSSLYKTQAVFNC